jgi:iron complex transport system substrate-binding protein
MNADQAMRSMPILLRATIAYVLAVVAVYAHAQGTGAAPPRIVSVGGSLTEIVYAVGAQQQLVAVDTTSLFPQEATKLPKVGYMRQLSAEGVLSMNPGVVLTTTDAGPPNVIQQLKDAGIKLMTAPSSDHTIDELRNKIRMVGQATGKATEAQSLDARVMRDYSDAQAYVAQQKSKPRVLFILATSSSGSASVAGDQTAAQALIQLAGGVNALSGFKGYRPMTAEAVIAAAPDVIVLTQQGLTAIGGVEKLLAAPGLALTPAGKARKVVAMDALYLLGFGPRLPQAMRELAERIRQ